MAAESRSVSTAHKVKALELDTAAAGYSGGEAVHFGDFPGMWAPGAPIAVSELGFDTEKEALAAVKTLGLPLREVQADLATTRMPERVNHASSEPALPPAEKPEPATVEGDA